MVKNCFSKDLTIRELAANRLLDFPADLFPKKSLKRIKRAVQDDELINFQLTLLTGYLQLEDQKARLMEFITIDTSAEYGFNESFSIDSKEWAAHLAMARMEGEEYVLHTEFVVVRIFYQVLLHQKLKSSYLAFLEQVAFVLKAGDELALIDLLDKDEKYYLTLASEYAEKEPIIDLHSFVIDLVAYGMNANPPLDIRNFNNPEQSIDWIYDTFNQKIESYDGVFRSRPRITYPPIYSRLKINIDTTFYQKKNYSKPTSNIFKIQPFADYYWNESKKIIPFSQKQFSPFPVMIDFTSYKNERMTNFRLF